jgi:hypothetical protein
LAWEMTSEKMDLYAEEPPKRAEIYTYEAPWPIYGMNWSVRSDKKFRVAIGSFIEEFRNKVSPYMIVQPLTKCFAV